MSKKRTALTTKQVMAWLNEQDFLTLDEIGSYAKALGQVKRYGDYLLNEDEPF